jgi:cytochrome c oxidase subunit III
MNTEERKLKEKTAKSLLWFGVGSISMMFAGLISAYIVSKGDMYWVHVKTPLSFWISTLVISISSLTITLAYKFHKNKSKALVFVFFTLLLGVVFSIYQFKGWTYLHSTGNSTADHIISPSEYVTLKGDVLGVGVNQEVVISLDYETGVFYSPRDVSGRKPLSNRNVFDSDGVVVLSGDYIKDISTTNRIQLNFIEGYFYSINDTELNKPLNKYYITPTGQLLLLGLYGDDYWISYDGDFLEFDKGYFYSSDDVGHLIPLNNQIVNYKNNASSYISVLTFLHILHLVGGMIYLIIVFFRILFNVKEYENGLKIKLVSMYWHFLGLLWLFLFFFLFLFH